ncbi:hypothetical protein JTE90_006649 [Oedothorax gibbosus]|uniref:Prolow-density lipoprotein receptor-related protein 1-like beta-propeller domain-containing protein n=1 Tax=Oedothorax gibbosus TaxID=931172 RepID=A0AAV6TS73_9ARAC|nr:hypothetical protein JTE90_006649 [Oedothorax gibbosus]
MLNLRLAASMCVFTLSCLVTADDQDGSALYCDGDIRNFSLASGSDSLLMSGIETPRVVDYHIKSKVFFWTDFRNKINKAPLWQEGARPSVLSGVDSHGIAVDWIHNLIYWTEYNNGAIGVSRLDGSMVRTVLKERRINPHAIVLNPAEGFMFWSDCGLRHNIQRCTMDGTNRKVIVKEDIEIVNSLAIDLDSQRIFWVDYIKRHLSSAKFDGNHRRNLITGQKTPRSIDIYGQHVYFVAFQGRHNAVYKASKIDGSGLTKVFDGKETLRSLKVFHPSKQLEGYDVCGDDNGGCSHLCLPTSSHTFSCACPNDRNMSSDKFTCLNSDGSVLTTPRLTTNAPSSHLPFTIPQTNFTSSTGSEVTPSLNTNASTSQLPLLVFQTNVGSTTEMNKNVDATIGSSCTYGIFAVVIASVVLIAVAGMWIFRKLLKRTAAKISIQNIVQRRNCEENNLYTEALL